MDQRDAGYTEAIEDAINIAQGFAIGAKAVGNHDRERCALDMIILLERKI